MYLYGRCATLRDVLLSVLHGKRTGYSRTFMRLLFARKCRLQASNGLLVLTLPLRTCLRPEAFAMRRGGKGKDFQTAAFSYEDLRVLEVAL